MRSIFPYLSRIPFATLEAIIKRVMTRSNDSHITVEVILARVVRPLSPWMEHILHPIACQTFALHDAGESKAWPSLRSLPEPAESFKTNEQRRIERVFLLLSSAYNGHSNPSRSKRPTVQDERVGPMDNTCPADIVAGLIFAMSSRQAGQGWRPDVRDWHGSGGSQPCIE